MDLLKCLPLYMVRDEKCNSNNSHQNLKAKERKREREREREQYYSFIYCT